VGPAGEGREIWGGGEGGAVGPLLGPKRGEAGGGGGEAGWAATPPAHEERGGRERGRGRLGRSASWAARPGWRAAVLKRGGEGGERKEKIFPFLISIFYMNAFTFSTIKNAWFDMVQQIKEINSRVYHYHMT
jgi:hypothetical protein